MDTPNARTPSVLLYGIEERPPLREAFFAALQHLLAIFIAIVTPPLIIAGALGLDHETTGFLVSMALFASGLSTFIQCRRIGGVGTGLLCIQGTSFSFIGPIISTGMLGGLPLIFGVCIAAAPVEMVISRLLRYTQKVITPLVSGIVVTLIGMSLIKVGIIACGGGTAAREAGTFGNPGSLGLAALVLGLVGGYPIGAKTAADLYRENLVSREEAERLLAFCNNSNPVFLISVLGVGVFGSVRAGVWLWLIHVLSALLTGLVFRGSGKSASRQELTRHPPFQAVSFAEAFTGAVRSSLAGILSVCAFVVFFYVLAQPLTAMGGRLGAVLVAALELFSLTPLLTADAFGFLLAAAAAGWGGLSVLCQTLAVLEGSGLRLRNCFLGKVVQSAFSLLLAALLVGYVLG